MLRLRPISLRDANEYVRKHHRHHKPVAGHKFSIGCEADVYYSKTFRVSNQSIAGTLQYKNTAGVVQNIPKDAFVSFERTRNGSRIGSVSVTADGQYELRLRKEYEFNWYTDEVELHYTGDGGMVYHATYPSLSSLFASPHIVLEPSAGE